VEQMDQLDDSLFKRMFRIVLVLLCHLKLDFLLLYGSWQEVPTGTGNFYLFYSDHGNLLRMLQALIEIFLMGFLAIDENKLEELSQGFSHHSGGILNGYVLALDEFGINTRAPYKTEVILPKDYQFRKSGFATRITSNKFIEGWEGKQKGML
jgi:hypothetical protein